MVKQRVKAIVSDYDGTLVPTAHVKDTSTNVIPTELEEILGNISAEIPVSIISTKDFEFLSKKVTFARVLSCIMGIETLVLTTHAFSRIIEKRILRADLAALQMNSKVLEAIAKEIFSCKDFSDMLIERKHTSDGILAGLTVDWRHLPSDDWSYYRREVTHFISSIVANLKKSPVPVDIYVQKYSEHPFVDIYSTECNKGMAFETVISELPCASAHGKDTLYLGDSENDNPAFRKAGISIGIRSDARVNPKLDCSYFLNYEQLSSFLMKLRNSDYLFNDELLMEAKKNEQAQSGMGQQ
jgi:HAD superfamily hydrolase (TIGR01484 family)